MAHMTCSRSAVHIPTYTLCIQPHSFTPIFSPEDTMKCPTNPSYPPQRKHSCRYTILSIYQAASARTSHYLPILRIRLVCSLCIFARTSWLYDFRREDSVDRDVPGFAELGYRKLLVKLGSLPVDMDSGEHCSYLPRLV